MTTHQKPRRAFILLSGGIDSTTCLHKAIVEYSPYSEEETLQRILDNQALWAQEVYTKPINWVETISIDYGQRHVREMEFARRTSEVHGIKHTILNLRTMYGEDFLGGKGVMLTDASVEVPNISYGDIKGVSPTYVPFRNGTLLSLITAYAQKWVNRERSLTLDTMEDSCGIYFGAHAEDAANWAYPDCTPEFIGAIANAIYVGTYRAVRLHTPLQWLMKHEIITLGAHLGVNFKDTWSCYKGEELHCGVCPTCRSRREAFIRAGIVDPTEYAHDYVKAA